MAPACGRAQGDAPFLDTQVICPSTPPRALRPETDVLTRGFDPTLSVGSARPAVFRAPTYVFASPEEAEKAFELMSGRAALGPGETIDLVYSRFNHPNAEIFEEQILPLEPAAQAPAVFNSGMAAITTVLLAGEAGRFDFVHRPDLRCDANVRARFSAPFGVRGVAVPAGTARRSIARFAKRRALRAVLIETPANPTTIMTDIARASATAATLAQPPLILVDNTFLGPAFQHPLAYGADVTLYSATKYLGGYSDIIGGVALARDPALITKIKGRRSLLGNILQPDECWILNTRLATVYLRMTRQSDNAQRIAEHLAAHPKITTVYYPTLFATPSSAASMKISAAARAA